MKGIVLAPNPTGTGHNVRMLRIGKELASNKNVTVLLGSKQSFFTPLFKSVNINVLDINEGLEVDFSENSNLNECLNWENMMTRYFVKNFFHGSKILKYILLFKKLQPELVISDYNINAHIAAIICGIKNTLITERHTFTLLSLDISDLKFGGFRVNDKDILEAQGVLSLLFNWVKENTNLIITDKVKLPGFDKNDVVEDENLHFVGAIYSSISNGNLTLKSSWLLNKKYIVATITNTTMIRENKEIALKTYIDAFSLIKRDIPTMKLVIIGNIDNPISREDVIYFSYIENWEELIKNAQLVISHPGWISVMDLAYLDIPAVFYMPNFMEYHEIEAFKRLQFLKLPTILGTDSNKLAKNILMSLNKKEKFISPYKILNPSKDGLIKTMNLLKGLIE